MEQHSKSSTWTLSGSFRSWLPALVRISGNSISMRSAPFAIRTSESPCAAPLRSTADPEERNISKSHGRTSPGSVVKFQVLGLQQGFNTLKTVLDDLDVAKSPSMSSGRALAKVPKAFAEVARLMLRCFFPRHGTPWETSPHAADSPSHAEPHIGDGIH